MILHQRCAGCLASSAWWPFASSCIACWQLDHRFAPWLSKNWSRPWLRKAAARIYQHSWLLAILSAMLHQWHRLASISISVGSSGMQSPLCDTPPGWRRHYLFRCILDAAAPLRWLACGSLQSCACGSSSSEDPRPDHPCLDRMTLRRLGTLIGSSLADCPRWPADGNSSFGIGWAGRACCVLFEVFPLLCAIIAIFVRSSRRFAP